MLPASTAAAASTFPTRMAVIQRSSPGLEPTARRGRTPRKSKRTPGRWPGDHADACSRVPADPHRREPVAGKADAKDQFQETGQAESSRPSHATSCRAQAACFEWSPGTSRHPDGARSIGGFTACPVRRQRRTRLIPRDSALGMRGTQNWRRGEGASQAGPRSGSNRCRRGILNATPTERTSHDGSIPGGDGV